MNETPHILVVDDHREIREPLARFLVKHGLRASQAANAAEARKSLRDQAIDLVVLDIMMPGEDGLSLCRSIRETSATPVILLTAMTEDTDRIVGLELGADDYVPKPFNPRELLARIKAVLRRANSLPAERGGELAADVLCFGRWTLDVNARSLIDEAGVVHALSTGDFLLLSAFVQHAGRVLTRDQLLDLTRGRRAEPFDRAIDNAVSRLRRKIEEDPKNPLLIQTVWGGGYRFSGEVKRS
ncbi:MAG: response regulator [Rhodospirillales bacterium]